MSKLILMCGLPGSGKSTWAKAFQKHFKDCVYISRDEIRFSLVKDEEEYFSQEDIVLDTFITQIAAALKQDTVVIADATHLTPKARNKVLFLLSQKRINPEYIDVVYMQTPIEQCLARNEKRKGTRAYVPKQVIRRMAAQLVEPTYGEITGGYDNIWIKNPNHVIYIKNKESK